MKQVVAIFFAVFFALVLSVFSGQAQNLDVNDLNLAGRYYQDQEFGKAADLYLKVYEVSHQPVYFTTFLNCLVELKDYDRAEKEIKRALRNNHTPELWVQYGYIQKQQHREDDAQKSFQRAMEEVAHNKPSYDLLANEFLSRSEFEYAEQVYLQAQKALPSENFHYELARIYLYQRNYQRMLDEYLILLRDNESMLINVENNIQSAIAMDVDGSLNDLLRNKLLTQIQKDPSVIVYNRLLIWFFMQEKKFGNALRQSIALDKRTGIEEENILNLSVIAGNNQEYTEAGNALDYIIGKGTNNENYARAMALRMVLRYRHFIDANLSQDVTSQELMSQFEECFTVLGYTPNTCQLVKDYAHFLAFYMQNTEKAAALLNQGMSIHGLNMLQRSELKLELADVQVYMGDEWSAVLLYSQVIDENKTNALGDEAKLKKARLSYYLGDFKWAQAQLDVIKASTSKLTSNDAFELSLMIRNNLDADTTDAALKMFARADLNLFRNKDSLAVQILDSISTKYPTHLLADDVLYKRAGIARKAGKYAQSTALLEKMLNDFPYDLLADDALFLLAEIYQYNLKQEDKARDLYKEMLVKYPSSIYVSESRNRFRILRGDKGIEDESALPVPENN